MARAGYWMLDYGYSARSELRGLATARDPSRRDSGAVGPGARPVVLLPGVYERWHFMLPLARQLEDLGHAVFFVPELGRNLLPIDESARLVAGLLAENDLRDVLLVAHSKGGLIGKYVMLRLDPEQRVDHLVAVNTPFSGSVWAERLKVPSIRIFDAADLTMTFLGARSPVNERITSVFGSYDQNVPAGSVLPGARNLRLAVGGHSRIIGSRAFAAVLAEQVARRG
ncbi:hypothetical protein B7R25_10805 [Subtercola boreus]|uniref:Alpha/beta hydrolase n=1 Tax=Subtercola boreus TaxID=120213 RepID=A0A3E0WB33_9MICO|nr:hypothetical protein B7R24_10740 [Subtercola boreus]RFA20219.1 hypothetical protein B7R23_10680 [Subtercola boreus]RFA26544.1 hypothetical protein B7R25_10805 [Subtercola boreus]